MNQAAQVTLIKEYLLRLDSGSTVDSGRVLKIPTSSYVSSDIAEQEREVLFKNHPQVLGLSGDLPEPGSFLTSQEFGVPILATRDLDGAFHVFVNSCRHRGSILAEEERGKRPNFVCPFHAWSYDAKGQLINVRKEEQFGKIDTSCNGLIELPSAEKAGLLYFHPDVNGDLDVDALLGPLAEELESWRLGEGVYIGNGQYDMALNWKIACDTFGENYHFQTLHKATVNNIIHGDIAHYEEYGNNHRTFFASKFIDVMRKRPEAQWSVNDSGFLIYFLFPNIQLLILPGAISLFRLYPDDSDAGRSVTRMSHYSADHLAVGAEGERVADIAPDTVYQADVSARLEISAEVQTELMASTLRDEDYYMGEKSQLAAASGKIEHFIFGKNEQAIQHFHNTCRDALGMSPLEDA